MAETVYKSIPDLDVLPGSLDGSETLPVVKAGKTYRRSWTNFFGSGWMANLLQAFSSFVAPNATHADDADTVGGEDKATLHNAANLTGNINLDRIPVELTGKNASKAGGVDFVNGNAGIYGIYSLSPGNEWIPPKGLYIIKTSDPTDRLYLDMKNSSGMWVTGSDYFYGGMFLFDGINFRLRNMVNVSGSVTFSIFYRKLA